MFTAVVPGPRKLRHEDCHRLEDYIIVRISTDKK